MKIILSLILASITLATIAIGSGAYNIAATEKHWVITEKIIEWARERSIEAHAKSLEVPPLDDEKLLLTGAEHYNAMCTICHLAPGLKPTELSMGLYPQAPVFYQQETVRDNTEKLNRAREYFWVIKNGLKMTAMPAWGINHDDSTVWAMVAFVLKMSNMTSEQYKNLTSSHKNYPHDHEHSNHDPE